MTSTLKIIHLEDLDTDAELVQRELKRGGIPFELKWVKNKTAFIEALATYPADLILSDHSLPSMTSIDALLLVKERNISIPFLLVTATISEEYAVEVMKLGAYDYILKDRMQRLSHAIEMAMEKWRGEKEKEIYLNNLIQSEQKFRGLIENGSDIIMLIDAHRTISYRSPNYTRITGWKSGEWTPSLSFEKIHPEDRHFLEEQFEQVLNHPSTTTQISFRERHKDDEYHWMEGTLTNLLYDASIRGIVSNIRDVTERKKTEGLLQQSRYLLNKATEVAHIGYFTADAHTMTGYWSDEVCRIYGIPPGSFDGRLETFISFIHEQDKERVLERIEKALQGKEPYRLDHRIVRPNGSICWVHHTGEVSFSENGQPLTIIGVTQEITEQKVLEEILREYNDRYDIVSKATNDAIWDWDIEKDAILWNHGIETIFGYGIRKMETPHSWWAKKVHAADYERVQRGLSETFNKGETHWASEYQYLCADGSYKYVLDRAYVVYKDSRPVRMIGAMQDITEQKRFLKEIEKLSLVASKTNNSVIITDPEGRIEWVNQAFTDLTEYTAEEVYGIKPGKLLQGSETHKSTAKRISQKLKHHEEITEDILNYAKSGRKFWVRLSISPVFDDTKKLNHFIAVMLDITEQKDFETKITTIARELSSLIENANVPIFGVDRNGYINEWNKVTSEISAYTKDEVLGQKWINLLDSSIHENVNKIIQKVLKGNPVSNYELPFQNKEGKRLTLLISISPRKDVNNSIVGLICLAQDLTELTAYRKGLEKIVEERTRDLNIALQKEKELVEMKSKFVSIASHEFRTPLSTISLATGFLRKYKNKLDTVDVDKKLEHIEQQIQHMVYLLDDVLLVGKADAGKMQANYTSVETAFFKELAQEVVKSTGQRHKLQFNEDCEMTVVLTDEKLVRNIVINLITNAFKFSPQGTQIRVGVQCSKNKLTLSVQDFGIGIPPPEIENLFQSFSRASNVGTIEGTGLGLSIVKKAVDLLNGSIEVVSELDVGTTFLVTLPLNNG